MAPATETLNLLRQYGLDPDPSQIIADGNVRRCPDTEKPGDRDSGWFVIHSLPNGRVVCTYGSWRRGEKDTKAVGEGGPLTDEERAELERLFEARKAEKARAAEIAAGEAAWIYSEETLPTEGHAYLSRKGVSSHGLRVMRSGSPYKRSGQLVIPIRNLAGAITSLQFIDRRGGKRFLAGGNVDQPVFWIGDPDEAETIALVEGYATGASVHQATGWPVAVCFNAGGLVRVAKAIRGHFPRPVIVVAGDNDKTTSETADNPFIAFGETNETAKTLANPGLEAAQQAARACRGVAVTPPETGDWNDVHARDGIEAVRAALVPIADRERSRNTIRRGVSLERGQAEIAAAIETFLIGTAARWDNETEPPIGLVRSTTGSGKSHLIRRHAAEFVRATGKRLVVAVPMHKLGEEYAEAFEVEHGMTAGVWRGLDQIDPEGNGDETMCLEPDLSDAAHKAGVPLADVCRECPSRGACGYIRQQNLDPRPMVWIVPHTTLFRARPKAIGEIGALVVDEDPSGQGVDENGKALAVDELEREIEAGAFGADRIAAETARLAVLEALRVAPDGPLTRKGLDGLDRGILDDLHRLAWNEKDRPEIKGKPKGEILATLRDAAERFNPRLPLLFRRLAEFLESGDDQAARITVRREMFVPQMGTVRGVRITGRSEIGKGWHVPTLIADATAQEAILREFWPGVALLADVEIEAPHQRVIRVDYSASKARLLESNGASDRRNQSRRNNLARLHRLLEVRCFQCWPATAALIANKAVLEALEAYGPLPKNLETGNFNGTRGLDRWRDVRVLFVVGRTKPDQAVSEAQARALTGRWDCPEMAEAVAWSICQAELLNGAIGRARGIRRTADNPVDVWIVNNEALPIEADMTLSWEQAQPTPAELMEARGVRLDGPTSAKGYWAVVAAVLPDLFETPDAARDAHKSRAVLSRGETSIGTISIDIPPRERWGLFKVRPPGSRYFVQAAVHPGRQALLRAVLEMKMEPLETAPAPVQAIEKQPEPQPIRRRWDGRWPPPGEVETIAGRFVAFGETIEGVPDLVGRVPPSWIDALRPTPPP